ncbi:MAG: methyltransferase [Alphaproteobacteria bacterium]|jgi:tRNA1(Val) A37 N6-methylase TrmN6|nr:methyltransferase [Alphaproteobacteria bacterium]
MNENISIDAFLSGKVKVYQDNSGYKSGVDAVLLASIIKAKQGQKVLDIGSGVGVASLCLASRIPNIEVYGLEVNEYFYGLSVKNSAENSLPSKYIPKLGSILTKNIFDFKFDIIMSNPPYYKNYQNKNNLSLKEQGNMEGVAKLADFIKFAFHNLKNHGCLYLIQRSERLKETLDLLVAKHWGNIEIHPIYSFAENPAKRFIVVAKKLGLADNTILHYGIVIHKKDTTYTVRAEGILRNGNSFY